MSVNKLVSDSLDNHSMYRLLTLSKELRDLKKAPRT